MIFYSDLFGIIGQERDELSARLLRMTRMEPFRKRPAGKLSGGMKQKLALMCTLLHKPRVLFLDEPTNGVDPVSRRDFWAILYRLVSDGLTVFVATAYLDEAERANRVGLMHQGRMIRCDTPAALKQELDETYYQIQVRRSREDCARFWKSNRACWRCSHRARIAFVRGLEAITSAEKLTRDAVRLAAHRAVARRRVHRAGAARKRCAHAA